MSLIYEHYGAALLGVVSKIVRKEDAAHDVFQDGLVIVWKYSQRYDSSKGRLFTWMVNILRNKALDYLRSQNRKPEIQMDQSDVVKMDKGVVEQNVQTIGLREQVERLDEDKRILIEMSYFMGYSQGDISKELDISLGTVKTRMRAALKELREVFVE